MGQDQDFAGINAGRARATRQGYSLAWVTSCRGGCTKALSGWGRNMAPSARLYGVAQKLAMFLENCRMYESPGPMICTIRYLSLAAGPALSGWT